MGKEGRKEGKKKERKGRKEGENPSCTLHWRTCPTTLQPTDEGVTSC
jgi:hypothetical protein